LLFDHEIQGAATSSAFGFDFPMSAMTRDLGDSGD